MKVKASKILGLGFLISLFLISCKQQTVEFPAPTEGTAIASFGEENGDNQTRREQWIENMHRTAPGTSWQAIEMANAQRRIAQKAANRSTDCFTNIDIDNSTQGFWFERGSLNQAGSVFATDYDPFSDMVYTISAGGTLWKGPLAGNGWEVLNQDLRFEVRTLKLVDMPDDGKRIICAVNGSPMYSDDNGLTWTLSTGVEILNAGQADFRKIIAVQEAGLTVHYAMGKPEYWSDYQLYRSEDSGKNWSAVYEFNTNLSNRLSLIKANNSEQIFVLVNTGGNAGTLLEWDATNSSFIEHMIPAELKLNEDRAFLVGSWIDDHYELYLLEEDQFLAKTSDLFTTFETNDGRLPDRPWTVGIFQSSRDDQLFLAGAVNLLKSINGAQSFNEQNNWGEYYQDVFGKLHADIMYIAEFKKADGSPFILISNHGGLSVSYDGMETTENIGLVNLNVSQYYSVRTDPTNPYVVYAGTQDQGFQRSTFGSDTDAEYFDQVISGDYGHIVFSNSGKAMWTVYPGGWVTYYNSPQTGGVTHSYEVISDDEGPWLPALAVAEGTEENSIFMAGGSIDGEAGSYLITLTFDGGDVQATQGDFDFLSNGGAVLSCLGVSSLNPDHVYAGTDNGRFFVSTDGGENFEQTIDFLPDGNYLYGAAIHPSKVDDQKVYFAGSGYNNPAVWMTENNGFSFNAISDGLPNTLVYDLTGTPDDAYLFAATEAGPYVYITAENTWKAMAGDCVPNQTYWSVEYVEALNTVRFGTYGRGIWDFNMSYISSNSETAALDAQLQIFPNPTNAFIQVDLQDVEGVSGARLFNQSGQLINQYSVSQLNQSIDVRQLAAGNYYLNITAKEGSQSIPFVKMD